MTYEQAAPSNLADDMLSGAKSISTFTGWEQRQIYHMTATGQLKSVFKVGRKLCARRSTLLREIQALEGGGR